MSKAHKERAHSKFSASGSERWLNCAASVALEEKSPPQKDSAQSVEGTLAHEVLELYLRTKINPDDVLIQWAYEEILDKIDLEMAQHVHKVGNSMLAIAEEHCVPLIAEERIPQKFIHPEMFGTVDGAVVQLFGTLHIMDFKYGSGHIVSAVKNTQMIQYALGYAEKYDWNFDEVTCHIFQPRAGKNWHKKWTISARELKEYWLPIWRKGVARVESGTAKPFEGSWCFFCRAKAICSAKQKRFSEKALDMFEELPPLERTNNGLKKESHQKESYKKSKRQKENPFKVLEENEDEESFF